MRPGLNAPRAGPWRDPGEYPERFAQQALGHNSKAVHHAYSKHAEVTVPSLDEWEKRKENPQKVIKPAVVQVDFKACEAGVAAAGAEATLAAMAQDG